MKKIYIETLGCSKNQVDTEMMLGILDDAYELAETAEDAEIIVVNTCLLYTSPSPRDRQKSRMPSSA